jgi:hypothetical protein
MQVLAWKGKSCGCGLIWSYFLLVGIKTNLGFEASFQICWNTIEHVEIIIGVGTFESECIFAK